MRRFRILTIAAHAFVIGWCLLILLPMALMVITPFKTRREMFTAPLTLPTQMNFDAFARAWKAGVPGYMINSMIVTMATVVLIVSISAMAAYALSAWRSRWAHVIYLLFVAAFAVPIQGVLIPLFQLMSSAGLINSIPGIVLPYTAYGIPFTLILLYAFFLEFPRELVEAARLDGCGPIETFFRIVVPLSGPAVASACILQAVFTWNEFLLALLLLPSASTKTLPVGLMVLRGAYQSDWPAVMAGLVIATLPMLVIFVVAQQHFVKSLAGLGK